MATKQNVAQLAASTVTEDELKAVERIAHPSPIDSATRFINRELSWLDFNHRVLEEAENRRHPLLERLRFLSISASNLDEFYSVRVAGLIGQAKADGTVTSADGRTPAQQLAVIKRRAEELLADQQRILQDLLSLMRAAGIELCTVNALTGGDRAWLEAWFMERVFPVVTPLAIDPAHPFPFIQNFGLVLALLLVREEVAGHARPIAPVYQVERFVRLPSVDAQCADPLHPAGGRRCPISQPRVSRVPPERSWHVQADPRYGRGI